MEEQPTDQRGPDDDLTAVLSIVDRFEAAWREGLSPTIGDFLPAPGSPHRQKALLELLDIDLEYHLEAEKDARLARYLGSYPELRQMDATHRLGGGRHRFRFTDATTTGGIAPPEASWVQGTHVYPTRTRTDRDPGGDRPPGEDDDADSGAVRIRYSLVRMHAEGGIGQVWAAHDHDLDREVALKRLRPSEPVTRASQSRFLREARVTGKLQHPGIVPVYELCRPGPGPESFYTMRFIKGRTLTEAVRAYHKVRKQGRANPLEQRELLAAFLSVCQTIAYAHSRGVIHRDLKGQNVVLGDFGEVMVVDWGLAKIIGEPDPAPSREPGAAPGVDEPPRHRSDAGPSTVDGEILGTPAYMAPEQAEGRIERIDARTDVHGLGAILYELLTGEPPFRGDLTEVLRQVVNEPPVPPRRRVPSTPRPLEGICLKCLSKRPEDRYQSASELAIDIRRYLADQPVAAVPEPWTSKFRRWIGRNRTFASAAGAALLVATVSLAAITVSLERANQREVGLRARAEGNWLLARQAVDRFFTRVSDEPRLKAVGLEKLRHDLLRDAQSFFEKLSRDRGREPEAEAERGGNDLRIARIDEELGEFNEAVTAAREACALFADLARRYPDAKAYREGLADSFEAMGIGQQGNLDLSGAESSFREAISNWDRLAGSDPGEPRYKHRTAVVLNRLGRLLCNKMHRTDEGVAVLNRCLSLCGEIFEGHPDDPRARLERSEALVLMGHALSPKELKRVEGMLREALEIREKLAAEHKDNPSYEARLVDACVLIAAAYSNARALEPVGTIYERVRRISDRLASEHRDVPLFVENHALIETLAAVSMALRGEHAQATESADRAARRAPRSGVVAIYAACCYANAAKAARGDKGLAPEHRERRAEEYLTRAMDYLRAARDTGLFRQPHFANGLREDPDLEPLQPRADFREFLDELGIAPKKPG